MSAKPRLLFKESSWFSAIDSPSWSSLCLTPSRSKSAIHDKSAAHRKHAIAAQLSGSGDLTPNYRPFQKLQTALAGGEACCRATISIVGNAGREAADTPTPLPLDLSLTGSVGLLLCACLLQTNNPAETSLLCYIGLPTRTGT